MVVVADTARAPLVAEADRIVVVVDLEALVITEIDMIGIHDQDLCKTRCSNIRNEKFSILSSSIPYYYMLLLINRQYYMK